MISLGIAPSQETFRNLAAAYAEPHRHYHTNAHINDCLAILDAAVHLAEDPAAVESAIWFHDAVYNPKAMDNERKSAEWARRFLEDSGVAKKRVSSVCDYILATEHHERPRTADARLMVDIDLSILGSPTDVYNAYEIAVRKEYQWVPYFIYRRRRSAVLASFLDRDHIYANEFFRVRFEEKARANIAAALEVL